MDIGAMHSTEQIVKGLAHMIPPYTSIVWMPPKHGFPFSDTLEKIIVVLFLFCLFFNL